MHTEVEFSYRAILNSEMPGGRGKRHFLHAS
jgi:hypothetical protein